MIRFKFLADVECSSTKDCVTLLNKELHQGVWKRVAKFKLAETEVRVFKDENEKFVSVTTHQYDYAGVKIFLNSDFRVLKEQVATLQVVAKKYFSYDYNDIYLNPFTFKLWCVGSDGGWGYSELSKARVAKIIEEEGMDDISELEVYGLGDEKYLEMNQHPTTGWIKSVEWEAEYSPEEESEFISVAKYTMLN